VAGGFVVAVVGVFTITGCFLDLTVFPSEVLAMV
jgi:hypothetical protein